MVDPLADGVIKAAEACAALKAAALRDRESGQELVRLRDSEGRLRKSLTQYVDHFGDPLKSARAALSQPEPPAAPIGMKMSDVRVGMRLRSVLPMAHGTGNEFATVTAIGYREFTYSLDADVLMGARLGVQLKDGNRHYGVAGFALFEPAAPKVEAEQIAPKCRNVLFPGDPSTCQDDPCACATVEAEQKGDE